MNVPFPPLFLWPVFIGMAVGAILWRQWQKRAILATPTGNWSKNTPAGWKHFRGYPWLLLIAGVIGAYSLWRFSAPSVRGVVLDASTGQGIPGATVARKVFRATQVSLTEGPGVFTEPWSRVETHTDSRGRFRLPGYVSVFPLGVRGTSGVAWKVFAPDYMIAGGCEQKGFPAPDGCGPDGGFSNPDPWVTTDSERRLGTIRLEIHVKPLEKGAGDSWGTYFQRLNTLTQYRYLTVEEFVSEAKEYAKNHNLTTSVYDAIYQVQQSLGGLNERGKYDRPEQALILLGIQEEYCKRHAEERRCAPDYFEHRRTFLQQGLTSNQRMIP
jgi:hypothetical protein